MLTPRRADSPVRVAPRGYGRARRLAFALWLIVAPCAGAPGARAEAAFPPAPAGREIMLWDAAEGLYERDGNLVVVARYDARTASPNQSRNIALLLGRIGAVMQAYVAADIPAEDRDYLGAALQNPDLLPKANREAARQIGPTEGRLVLEFMGGAALIRQGRATIAALDLGKAAQDWKAERLAQSDAAGLRAFAARHGEILDMVRLDAATLHPARLLTVAPSGADPLESRDALLRAYCDGPACALRPAAHLALARSLSTPSEAAAVHALLARWTSDTGARAEAEAALKDVWAGDPARVEFLAVLQRCASANAAPGLAGLILARCGLYWPPPSRPAPEALARAEAAFRAGGDPQGALRLFLQAVEQDPAQARAWSYLGSIYLYLKQDGAALAALHQSLLLDPRSLDARLNLADAYLRLGAPALAKALHQDILARLAAGQTAEFTQNIKGEVTARLGGAHPLTTR